MDIVRASKLLLEIVTPTREVLSHKVDSVTLPGELGELQALPLHRPLLTSLRSGRLVWRSRSVSEIYEVKGGFAEIRADRVVVLADECSLISDHEDTTA